MIAPPPADAGETEDGGLAGEIRGEGDALIKLGEQNFAKWAPRLLAHGGKDAACGWCRRSVSISRREPGQRLCQQGHRRLLAAEKQNLSPAGILASRRDQEKPLYKNGRKRGPAHKSRMTLRTAASTWCGTMGSGGVGMNRMVRSRTGSASIRTAATRHRCRGHRLCLRARLSSQGGPRPPGGDQSRLHVDQQMAAASFSESMESSPIPVGPTPRACCGTADPIRSHPACRVRANHDPAAGAAWPGRRAISPASPRSSAWEVTERVTPRGRRATDGEHSRAAEYRSSLWVAALAALP